MPKLDKYELSQLFKNQKGFAPILVILVLLAGVVGGLVLIKNPQIFQPRASESGETLNVRASCSKGLLDIGINGSANANISLYKIRGAKNPGELKRPRTSQWWNARDHQALGDIIVDISPSQLGASGSSDVYTHKDVALGEYDIWVSAIKYDGTIVPNAYIDELVTCSSVPSPIGIGSTAPIGVGSTAPVAKSIPDLSCEANGRLLRIVSLPEGVGEYIVKLDNKKDEWDNTCISSWGDSCIVAPVGQVPGALVGVNAWFTIRPNNEYRFWYRKINNDALGPESKVYKFTCVRKQNTGSSVSAQSDESDIYQPEVTED